MFYAILFVLIDIAFTIIGSLTFWPVKSWIDFYIPVILFVGGYLAIVILFLLVYQIINIFTINMKKEYEKPTKFHRFLINHALDYIRHIVGIRVKVTGKEHLAGNENVVFICNHRSVFDNFVISPHLFMKKHIAFISKPSNFRIPWAGPLMVRLGYFSIDKNDLIQSLGVIKKATKRIQDGYCSIGVYPEGTRSKDGKTVGPFHEGVFNIAIHSKSPILIATIRGTQDVHKRIFRGTKVEVHILKKMAYEEYQDMPAKQLSETVRDMIIEDLKDEK